MQAVSKKGFPRKLIELFTNSLEYNPNMQAVSKKGFPRKFIELLQFLLSTIRICKQFQKKFSK